MRGAAAAGGSLEIECCPGSWVPYPDAGNATCCAECGTVFVTSPAAAGPEPEPEPEAGG